MSDARSPDDTASHRQTVLDFIASQQLGVLCTINPLGLPQAATMAISQTDKLELIFQTPNTTRKYANLQKNKYVAVVFGWDRNDPITAQYEGVAREVTDDEERAACANIHDAKKGPGARSYSHIPENKFFIVTPTQIRYSDLKNNVYFTV